MRFIVSTILIALLSFAAGLYLPWWSIALVAFLVAFFIGQKPWMAYLSGFVACLLLWGLLALWIDVQNDHILSERMAILFPLGGSSLLLVFVTGLLAAIIGGMAALSGSYLLKYLLEHGPVKVKELVRKYTHA
jgi:hypothetical protein